MKLIADRMVTVQGKTPTNDVGYIQKATGTTAYAAGDVISEVTTNDHYVFGGLGMEPERSGYIVNARMTVLANQSTKPDLELWLFSSDIAEVADNGVFAPTDVEIITCIGVIEFPSTDWKVGLSGSGASGNIFQEAYLPRGRPLPFRTDDDDTDVYGQLVVRNAYTPITSEQFYAFLDVVQN